MNDGVRSWRGAFYARRDSHIGTETNAGRKFTKFVQWTDFRISRRFHWSSVVLDSHIVFLSTETRPICSRTLLGFAPLLHHTTIHRALKNANWLSTVVVDCECIISSSSLFSLYLFFPHYSRFTGSVPDLLLLLLLLTTTTPPVPADDDDDDRWHWGRNNSN